MRKLILVSLTISLRLAAQSSGPRPRTVALRGSLEHRLGQLVDAPPFNRATWGIYVVDHRGRVLYQRNADHFSVPASNTKLVVTAAAAVLLAPDYRVTTSLYVNGRVDGGVLYGDLILYGRGDPTWSQRCFSVDTLAPGACDSMFTAVDAIADSVRARGIHRITGKLVGDGSFFEPTLIHSSWNAWDLTWWYAAPVSGLGFHDNSVDFHVAPGAAVDAPPAITWSPDLGLFTFENRARTVPADSGSSVGDNFFRGPSGWTLRAEGTVALGHKPWIESVALPDPNVYAARALAASLGRKGVAVSGGAAGTTDSLAYRAARTAGPPLVDYRGRPLPDILFPILNTSQNWFAEMLLKLLGRELKGDGSWSAGLEVERRFLIDSVHIDSTAFALEDGSGLAAGNLVTPQAFAQLLAYMHRHPKGGPFVAALPHAGQPGSLLKRFVGSPLEGRVIAKTGSIDRVNSLSGYIELGGGRTTTFSVQANGHAVPASQMLAQIDSVVVEIGKTR
ncbi:MAG TPA: D-alanyl-D-alanine carboxypeptidase/D-alanyl-D-alanine-endopeptidase [Gemmatimonadales bacterium]|nr:D-alanyl-D-alanine carboxypeptidase/D-alanyl-D-alanine-endopeptidase [Gemmatimonadales bacterium]